MKPVIRSATLTCALLIAGIASAHHSYGMFDRQKEQKLEGTVQEFQWTNPHSRVSIVSPDGKGGTATWDIEIGPPGQLIRSGWKHNSLKPGDKVQLLINPLRDGSPGGHLLMVTTVSGENLYDIVFKKPPKPGDKPAEAGAANEPAK